MEGKIFQYLRHSKTFSFPFLFQPGMKCNLILDCSIVFSWLLLLSYFAYDNVTSGEYWDQFYNVTDSFILTWGTRIQNLTCIILAIVIILMTCMQVFFHRSNFHMLFDCLVYVDKILENEFHCDLQFELCAKYNKTIYIQGENENGILFFVFFTYPSFITLFSAFHIYF